MWQKYQHRPDKKAGVTSFEMGKDYIKVQFRDPRVYVYNYKKPGRKDVEKMKELAKTGAGLSTYISQHIRDNYFDIE